MNKLPAGFVAPFWLSPRNLYIYDAKNQMALDLPAGPRARGWGRIQYLPNPDKEMDDWLAYVHEHVGSETDPEKVLQLLNDSVI